jgi:hypothetical protein
MALGEFFSRKNSPMIYLVNLTKTWLGDFLGYFSLSLGDFLTKTSGHPARDKHSSLLQKSLN